jgi:hypothetical protein
MNYFVFSALRFFLGVFFSYGVAIICYLIGASELVQGYWAGAAIVFYLVKTKNLKL